MSEPILLQEKQPQRFEGRNIRTPKRSGATNDIYLVQFEITREAWESLESIPKNALLEGIIWFHYGDPEPVEEKQEKPKREKKPPKEKEPLTLEQRFWQGFCGHGSLNNADLRKCLVDYGYALPDSDWRNNDLVKHALYKVFNAGEVVIESLAEIQPADFIALLEEWKLDALVISASRILREAQA